MKKLTPNPFQYGNPVEGDYYLPRPELAATLKRFLESRIHTVLMGPRRFGKTSFTLDLLQDFEKTKYTALYIDIFNITSHKDFLQQLLRAMQSTKSFSSTVKALWKKIKQLTPSLSAEIDPVSAQVSFNLAITSLTNEDTKTAIQDLFESLTKLGSKVIVVIDEFRTNRSI